jgi:hypothetical protein
MQSIIDRIVAHFQDHTGVEGVYLSGSLAGPQRDAFSDIDLGIASRNSPDDFKQVYALHPAIMSPIGPPLHFIERGWDHCQMVAALYGKSQFPPVGLEVDLVFSQLQHVGEQMPYANYAILFDRDGRLAQALAAVSGPRPRDAARQDIQHHLAGLPFWVHDAHKAYRRGDSFHFQSQLESIRSAVFMTAAARRGVWLPGSKRAATYLSASEREIVQASYQEFSEHSLRRLVTLYVQCLSAIQAAYGLDQEVQLVQSRLADLL